jgi:hypothetical protein
MSRSIVSSSVAAAMALAASLQAGAAPTVLYDQSDFGAGIGPEVSQLLSANDFVLAEPARISGFKVWLRDGTAATGSDGVADGVFRSFSGTLSWYFFADTADAPGALIASGNAAAPAVVDTGINTLLEPEDVFEITVSLPAEMALAAGRGWFGLREGAVGSAYDGSGIVWMGSQATQGAGRYTFFDGANIGDLSGPSAIDAAFQLVGQPVSEPTTLALLLAAALAALAALRRRRWLAGLGAAALLSPTAQAAGATQYVYAPIACRTFDGALWIFPNGQIGNKHPSQTMRVLCPMIHEAKQDDSDKIQVSIVNANRSKRLRCRVFFNHPHANVDPPSFVSAWVGAGGNSAGVETGTLVIEGHQYLGGSHMLECEVPPKSNEDRFDGISRIGSYKSGVD